MRFGSLASCLVTALWAASAPAAIAPAQVLVVYNSASAEAAPLLAAYLAAHPGIPAANIVDLDSAALLTADLTRAQFVSLVRDPIRAHLQAAGPPDPPDIVAICLLRPLPHRVQDADFAGVGDNPTQAGNETNAGDATYAALDTELSLLWQDLETGEAGASMDSKADNMIVNPYRQQTVGIDSFDRNNITIPKTLVNGSGFLWRLGNHSGPSKLTPGDIYLVCRIDGPSSDDAVALVARSAHLYANKARHRIVLDEYDLKVRGDLDDDGVFATNDPLNAGDDYEQIASLLQALLWDVRYDDTFDFISGAEEMMPLIAYASYGENHSLGGAGESPPGNGVYIEDFRFPRGAVFNTVESYNGRGLNGLGTLFNQEQAADFVAVGGTFAVANVYEPFTFSICDNEFLLQNLYVNGLTFAEAAWSSMPAVSWQQIALGDPLATVAAISDPAVPLGDLNGDGAVNGADITYFQRLLTDGIGPHRAEFPGLDPVARADFNDDLAVTSADLPGFLEALLGL